MVELRRRDVLRHRDQVVQLNHLPLVAAHVDRTQVGGFVALLAVDLGQYLVLLAVHVEITQSLAAEPVLERLGDVARRDAQHVGLVAADLDAHFGFAEFQVHVGHLEHGAFVDPGHEFGQHLLQPFEVGGLEDVLYGHTSAASAEGALLLYERARLGFRTNGGRDLFGDLHLRPFAGRDVRQGDADVARAARHAGRHGLGFGHERVDQAVDILGVVADVFVGGSLRAAGGDRDLRTVLQRGHLGRDGAPQPADQHDGQHHDRQGDPAAAQERCERAAVKVVEPYEERFGLAVKPAFLLLADEQFRRQHRGDGERRKGRNDHGARNHHAEFAEQAPGYALHEDDREEDGDQRDRGGDHGEEDLLGALDAGVAGRHAAFDADVDVFGHHDGVVDDQSHREHHGQHRQHVDRESRGIHHEERADQRHGDHDAGDQRHAPVAQEEEDDDDDQDESLVDGGPHLVDRGADEARVVESVGGHHVVREVLFHRLHALVDGVGYLDVVGARLGDHHHADHRDAVHLHITARVLRTQFGASHVAQADDAVGVLAHHQVVELLRGVHQAHRADGQLGGVALDAARGQFDILAVEGVFDVGGGDAVTGHLGRIEPQAHRVAFLAPYLHAAHVADGLQLLFDREVGDLAQFQQRPLVALDGHHQDRRGVGVGFGHRRGIAVAGQVALGARHLVAHVVGGGFEVHRELELHGDTALALTADARQRTDARDAVDVLLERLGNLVFDYVGIGARIGAGDGDDRVVDAGVLPHAEVAVPDEAE